MKYDLEKIAEEAAVCSVMTKEAVSPKGIGIPMEQMALMGLGGAGIGGLGSLARDAMVGDKLSFKRALIGALLGGGAGAGIPMAASLAGYNPGGWFIGQGKPAVTKDMLSQRQKGIDQMMANEKWLTTGAGRFIPFSDRLAKSERENADIFQGEEDALKKIIDRANEFKSEGPGTYSNLGNRAKWHGAGFLGTEAVARMIPKNLSVSETSKAINDEIAEITRQIGAATDAAIPIDPTNPALGYKPGTQDLIPGLLERQKKLRVLAGKAKLLAKSEEKGFLGMLGESPGKLIKYLKKIGRKSTRGHSVPGAARHHARRAVVANSSVSTSGVLKRVLSRLRRSLKGPAKAVIGKTKGQTIYHGAGKLGVVPSLTKKSLKRFGVRLAGHGVNAYLAITGIFDFVKGREAIGNVDTLLGKVQAGDTAAEAKLAKLLNSWLGMPKPDPKATP
jgi:hypothetical protein